MLLGCGLHHADVSTSIALIIAHAHTHTVMTDVKICDATDDKHERDTKNYTNCDRRKEDRTEQECAPREEIHDWWCARAHTQMLSFGQ